MLIVALFIIAPKWKQPKCPSVDKWISQIWKSVHRLFSLKELSSTRECYIMAAPWKYYATWKSPDKRPHIVWFHLYARSGKVRSVETARWVFAGGQEEVEGGGQLLHGNWFPLWRMQMFGIWHWWQCTVLWTHQAPRSQRKTKSRMVKLRCLLSGQCCLPDIAYLMMIQSVQTPRVLVSSCPCHTTLSKSIVGGKGLPCCSSRSQPAQVKSKLLKQTCKNTACWLGCNSCFSGFLIHPGPPTQPIALLSGLGAFIN